MRFHLDAQTCDLIRTGVSPVEAVRRARERFGSVEAMKNECRRVRGLRFIDELGLGAAHIRLVLRMLFKSRLPSSRT